MKNFYRYLSAVATITTAFTILNYDSQTGLYARIKDGSVWPQVQKQYTTMKGATFDQNGYNASERILKTKYVPNYNCAIDGTLEYCKKPFKRHGQ